MTHSMPPAAGALIAPMCIRNLPTAMRDRRPFLLTRRLLAIDVDLIRER
jgi:hypothetical protein